MDFKTTINIADVKSATDLAKLIDHTILKPEATRADVMRLCAEAREFGFYSVCVNPYFVAACMQELKGSGTCVVSVVGFPLGASTTETKVFETGDAVHAGAKEIDMVMNAGALKSGDYGSVASDIRSVVQVAGDIPVKVILETSLFGPDEIRLACQLSVEAGAAYVKTSTGFGKCGATVEHVKIMRSCVGPGIGVKASGGVRRLDEALAMIQAGASRIGASSSVAMMGEAEKFFH